MGQRVGEVVQPVKLAKHSASSRLRSASPGRVAPDATLVEAAAGEPGGGGRGADANHHRSPAQEKQFQRLKRKLARVEKTRLQPPKKT